MKTFAARDYCRTRRPAARCWPRDTRDPEIRMRSQATSVWARSSIRALEKFAIAYAGQVTADYEAFRKAVRAGKN